MNIPRKVEWFPGIMGAFCGYLRQGKTMAAVLEAYKLKKQGWRVASNIPVVFADELLVSLEDLLAVRKSVILWDEVQASVDSRAFAKNVDITQQGILFGKRGNVVIMTLPHFDMLDIRFRQLTRYVFNCSKVIAPRSPYPSKWASLIEVNVYPQVSNFLIPIGKRLMYHYPMYGTYDTLYENVALLPLENNKPLKTSHKLHSPHAPERASAQGGGLELSSSSRSLY